jgi:hypothetical protein
MKLLEARVNGNPRQVNTKYGEKAVMDVVTADGTEIAIWRPAGDMEVMGRMNGERVSIAIDSKGKASLVTQAPSPKPPKVLTLLPSSPAAARRSPIIFSGWASYTRIVWIQPHGCRKRWN